MAIGYLSRRSLPQSVTQCNHAVMRVAVNTTSPAAQLIGMALLTSGLLAIAYANGLDAAFVFDDAYSIVDNTSIRQLVPLGNVLWARAEGGRTHDSRPLLNLSLAIDYALHGLWRPGFRLANLLIHLINAVLVVDISRRLLRLTGGFSAATAGRLAVVIGLLWALHPLHTNVITYVIQRAESLAAVFLLAACDAAIIALTSGRGTAAVAAVAFAVLGAFAKETTAVVLPLVGLFDWSFRDRLAWLPTAGASRRLRPWLYAGLCLNPAAIVGLAVLLGGRGGSAGLGTASTWRYLLTQTEAVWLYGGRLCWPRPLVLDYGDGLATDLAAVWPAATAAAAVLSLVVFGLGCCPRRVFPVAAALLLVGPSSSIVPVATQTMAEHRFYLASACLIAAAVAGAGSWASRLSAARLRPVAMVGVLLVAPLLAAEVTRIRERNRDFATAVTLWQQNLRDWPANDRSATNLVAALIREGRFAEAGPLAGRLVREFPKRHRNWFNQGRLLAEAGQNAAAITAFDQALRLAPGDIDCRINRAIVRSRRPDLAAAISELNAVIGQRPDLAKAWLARGLAWLRAGDPARAIGDLEMAVRLDPDNTAAHRNLTVARQALEGEVR